MRINLLINQETVRESTTKETNSRLKINCEEVLKDQV